MFTITGVASYSQYIAKWLRNHSTTRILHYTVDVHTTSEASPTSEINIVSMLLLLITTTTTTNNNNNHDDKTENNNDNDTTIMNKTY